MAANKNKQEKKPAMGQEKSKDKKANRRGAARLAAVQALYQMDIAGAGINDIFAEFERATNTCRPRRHSSVTWCPAWCAIRRNSIR